MYINIVKSKNAVSYYLCEAYRTAQGKSKTRVVESLGNAEHIKDTYHVDDAEAWCREYAKQKTQEAKVLAQKNNRTISIEFSESKSKSEDSSIFNAGYLILESLYHSFGLGNICEEIKLKHPHIKGFNLDHVLRTLLFGRIIEPSSKLGLTENIQRKFLESHDIQIQHIYRAMDLLEQHEDLIQKRLYQYSSAALGKRNVGRLYYDCTNFYTEKESEDCDVKGKSEEWYRDHKLRKYGYSKEHRPNPIVQIGLFMDGDGMPLGFCINPGNTNEQVTIKPLEQKLIDNFLKTDIVVCTDAGLGSTEMRKYNNVTEDDPLSLLGFRGKRHYICVQSIKKLKKELKEWAVAPTGWSYQLKRHNVTEKVKNFDLNAITEENYQQYYDVVFYKERTIAEDGLDQRLIATFSLKYKAYRENLRNNRVKRASKIIKNGTYDSVNELSPKNLIKTTYLTEDGQEATFSKAEIDLEKVETDKLYDGFYCIATNLFKEECSVQEVVAIQDRRWEIEECFRIMKTDLRSRPFYHNKDTRIKAHFLTCFTALLLLRGLERRIADNSKENDRYPDGKYTISELLEALRAISLIRIAEGQAYVPDYKNSEVITELLRIFELEEFTRQVVMKDDLKKILKKIKNSPEMITDE